MSPLAPSSVWPPTPKLDDEPLPGCYPGTSEMFAFVEKILPLLDDFQKHASLINGGIPCVIRKDKYTHWTANVVFEVAFPSINTFWILRIRHDLTPDAQNIDGTPSYWHNQVNAEVSAMRIVKQQTTIPVPEVFDFGDCDSVFGHPYMLMSCLPGGRPGEMGLCVKTLKSPIDLFELNPGKEEIVKRMYHQLADAHAQLSKVTLPALGSVSSRKKEDGTFEFGVVEPSEGFPVYSCSYQLWDVFCREILEQLSLDGEEVASEDRLAVSMFRASIMALTDTKDAFGPFPLFHSDLCSNNVLIDEQGNLTGLIDWELAETAPIEMFAGFGSVSFDSLYPSDVPNSRQELFISALKQIEELDPTSPFPSGRLLSELHSSLAVRLGYHIMHQMPTTRALGVLSGTLYSKLEEEIPNWLESPWLETPLGQAILELPQTE